MNDLISRKAAIEAVDFFAIDPGDGWNDIANERNRVLEYASNKIMHIQPAQRWIPVSERLPEFDELVLVWVENKDPKGRFNKPGIHTAQLQKKEPKHDPEGKMNFWGIPGYDSEWTVWAWSYFSEPDVKAWMPLPEPYKEENNEQVQG